MAVEEHGGQTVGPLGRRRLAAGQVGLDERPPALGPGRTEDGEGSKVGLPPPPTARRARLARREGAERGVGVVGDLARPDQVPEGVERLVVVGTRQLPEEAGAPALEDPAQAVVLG